MENDVQRKAASRSTTHDHDFPLPMKNRAKENLYNKEI